MGNDSIKLKVSFLKSYMLLSFQTIFKNILPLLYPVVVALTTYIYVLYSPCSIIYKSAVDTTPDWLVLTCGLSTFPFMLLGLTLFGTVFVLFYFLLNGFGLGFSSFVLRLTFLVSLLLLIYQLYLQIESLILHKTLYFTYTPLYLIILFIVSYYLNQPPKFPNLILIPVESKMIMNGMEYNLAKTGQVVLSRTKVTQVQNAVTKIHINWMIRIENDGQNIIIYDSHDYLRSPYPDFWIPLERIARRIAYLLDYSFIDKTGILELERQTEITDESPLMNLINNDRLQTPLISNDKKEKDLTVDDVLDNFTKKVDKEPYKVSKSNVVNPIIEQIPKSSIELTKDGYLISWSYNTVNTSDTGIFNPRMKKPFLYVILFILLTNIPATIYRLITDPSFQLLVAIPAALSVFIMLLFLYLFFDRENHLVINSRNVQLRHRNLTINLIRSFVNTIRIRFMDIDPEELDERIDFFHSFNSKSIPFDSIENIQIGENVEILSTVGRLELPGETHSLGPFKVVREMLLNILIEVADYDPSTKFRINGYTCFNCRSPIDYKDQSCSNCGQLAPKCMICFISPSANSEIVQFGCCTSYAHYDHAINWIKERKNCPYCKTTKPELISVKI